jgi:general secretion pathway protein B
MSFILDALKKSESDRQRQGGPALFEVKVAAPRSALPPWAIAIAVLFAANLALVLWMLLRHPAPPPAAAAGPAAAPRAAPAVETAALVSTPAAAPAALPAPPPVPAAAASLPPPATSPAERLASPAGSAAEPTGTAAPSNPDDYAPAADPTIASGLGRVKRGTEAGVPLYQQLVANPGGTQLPALRLDLHAYAERPADRWVLINMHRVREGDSLPEGVRVERITPSGAVLSYQGSQFLLTQ